MTPEQRLFAEHPNEAFVEACPGAGKTRTVLARIAHLASTLPPRRGVAVLSFTNKAIEEFKTRAARENLGRSLRLPGFIGTFDSFVRHFLFFAGRNEGHALKPHVVDSWDNLDIWIRLRGQNAFAGPGVSLDLFDPITHGINPENITHSGLRRHVLDHRAEYVRVAQSVHQSLNRRGFFSTGDARSIAVRRIRQREWGDILGRVLAGRFVEIVVDEAQDCNPLDLEILAWLRHAGIRVTVVCDMNQSIYAFRDGDPTHLAEFADNYRAEDRLALTGNFRSSPSICSLAASLRSRNEIPDTSLGASQNTTHPVAVYAYAGRRVPSDIGRWFIAHAGSPDIGIPPSELIMLAHKASSARLASGDFSALGHGTSMLEQLARAVGEFWCCTTRHSKASALASVEKFLLDLAGQRDRGESVSRATQRLALDSRLLKRQALELLMRLPRTCRDTVADRSAWVDCARTVVEELEVRLPAGQTIRRVLQDRRDSEWFRHLEQADAGTVLRHSTIHNAKGGEYRGVCVVIPPDDRGRTTQLFDAWDQRTDHEPNRVIYVGVTRGIDLAALAVPTAFLDRCTAILTQRGVPHRLFR